jgi:hypothetical protein
MNPLKHFKEFLDLKEPNSLPWGEWDKWHEKTRAERPIAYFLSETVPDVSERIWKIITSPYHNTRNFIRYKFIAPMHIIKTGLTPGYWDMDSRLMHGMFNMLVDFVEIEKAWMTVVFNDDDKKYKCPWYCIGWTRWLTWRSAEAGLDHLRWEAGLDAAELPEEQKAITQAIAAREILDLYDWWKNRRPSRKDSMYISGWSDWCDIHPIGSIFKGEKTPENSSRVKEMFDKMHKIEAEYDEEDELMLTRLIKIRKHLWT